MCAKAGKSRTRVGFSLLELLVVIIILAIAAAIVIPNVSGAKGIEAMSAARIITSDLQYAQNVAITYQNPVTVTFNPAGESYSLSNTSGPLIHPMTKEAYSTSFGSQSDFESVDIVSANFAGNSSVSFDELGTPNNAGTVTVQAGSYAYQISVAVATGRVTVVPVGP